MMPVIRQRTAIGLGLLLAGGCYALVAQPAIAEGGVGLTLLGGATGTQPLWMALGLSIPVLVIATLAAAMGNPLVGPLILSGGLIAAAGFGGSIDGWIRSIESSGAFWLLAGESVVWIGLIVAARLLVRQAWPVLRRKLPPPLRSAYCAETGERHDDEPVQMAGKAALCLLLSIVFVFLITRWALVDYIVILVIAMALVTVAWLVTELVSSAEKRPLAHAAIGPAFLSSIVTTVVGSAALMFLQHSADPGQVIGSMLVAFVAASLLAHQLYPTPARLPMLLSPLFVGLATYIWMAMSNDTAQVILTRYFAEYPQAKDAITTLPPPALALPVFYASAGVVGVCIGLGWSQTIHLNADRHVAVAT